MKMTTMKVLGAVAMMGMSGIAAAEEAPALSKSGAPYTLSGYGDVPLGYWTKDSALMDARKYAEDGFHIEVWTALGKRVFPAM